MRLKLNILLITLLTLFSCAKEGGGRVDYGPETGNLCVRFDVSDMNPPILGVTNDNADAGHVLLEGSDGVMKIGRMWLVDKAGNVVVFRKTEDNNSNSRIMKFSNVKRGEYKLYILLNSTDLDGFTEGKEIDDNFKKKCLATIAAGASPEYTVESGVPCSIVKDVAIAAGNNNVDVSLQRCVGRLTVVVLNNIHDCQLAIGGIGLSAVNPSTGYYFPQSDGSVPSYENLAFHDLNYTNPVVILPSKIKSFSTVMSTRRKTYLKAFRSDSLGRCIVEIKSLQSLVLSSLPLMPFYLVVRLRLTISTIMASRNG